ncbi:MAG: type II toxin-antitoxin system VapC family toxin [Kineosporiaceae bacterium]
MTTIVVDTSAVLAAKDEDHPYHAAVASVLSADSTFLLSPFVMAECDYMLTSRLSPSAARDFLDEVVTGAYELVDFDAGDVAVAGGIMDRYRDLDIGLADASLSVIAARAQTVRILTFDHRHFRAVAPLWGAPAFVLLPADDGG